MSTVPEDRTVAIRDVCPRDGLQSERSVDPIARAELAGALAAAGLADVEAAAFVSPAAVPSMAGAAALVAALPIGLATTWWALVPNRKGAELAVAAGITSFTVTVSASDGYSHKNVGIGTADAVAGLPDIIETAAKAASADVAIDVVVSCCFGSPFGDVTDVAIVADVVAAIRDVGDVRMTLADTTGTATPRRIDVVLDAVGTDVGLHLHDTRGTALANALHAIERGVRRFDTSAGGLGGSPFAPGAGGNLATEDLVLMLNDLGMVTGVDLDALLRVSRALPGLVGHDVPSRTTAAGPLVPFA